MTDVFDDFTSAGIGIITFSRPGYGRTPLSSGKTAEETADLLAALLDELSIEKVVIYGISGGGPTTLNFALRHPDRCFGMMTDAAVTGEFKSPMFEECQKWYAKMANSSPTGARMALWMA